MKIEEAMLRRMFKDNLQLAHQFLEINSLASADQHLRAAKQNLDQLAAQRDQDGSKIIDIGPLCPIGPTAA